MTDAHGSPVWYFGASEDLVNKRDTEAARALLEETRAEIRAGQQPKGLAEALNAKGARGNGQWVVNRAAQLEWEGVVRTASDDAAAGSNELSCDRAGPRSCLRAHHGAAIWR